MTLQQRTRTLQLAGIIGPQPARPTRPKNPSTSRRLVGPRDLDSAPMVAWREAHEVTVDRHRSMLTFGRFPELETRSAAGDNVLAYTNAPQTAPAGRMSGYIARFGEWTTVDSMYEGRFMERLQMGAFARSFREHGTALKIQFNHGRDARVGESPIAVPEMLCETPDGAWMEARLLDGVDPVVVSGLRERILGASFRFTVHDGGERWVDHPARSAQNDSGLPERTLTSVDCREAGPVVFGAYDGAQLSVG
jgi:phage head maturation protease